MKSKTKNFIYSIILLLIVVFVTTVFLEIIIRLFFSQNINYTQFDSAMMYRHVPNLKFAYSRQEFNNEIAFNSKGLRDFEYEYLKNPDVYRVLILGDSFPEALQLKLNESFPKILEKKLSKNGRYEVINAGVGGYGTENELLFFEYEGIKYKPDHVILAFSLNDVNDNMLSPLLSLKNNALIKNIPVKASLPKKFLLYCSRHSHLCSLTQTVLLQGLNENEMLRMLFDKLRISSRGENERIALKIDYEAYLKSSSEEFEKGLNETFAEILYLNRILKQNNIKFTILLIPSREQVDETKLKQFIIKNKINEPGLDVTNMQKKISKFAQENNITYLDVLPQFRQKNINNTFYFEIDGHWNAKGHELAAELLYDYLAKQIS